MLLPGCRRQEKKLFIGYHAPLSDGSKNIEKIIPASEIFFNVYYQAYVSELQAFSEGDE
jgi:hypothetical protein